MADKRGISIIFPDGSYDGCRTLSDVTIHDLALDVICRNLSDKEKEQSLILGIMSKITADPEVVQFRLDVFEDIYGNPAFREKMLGILNKIEFLKDFGSFRRDNEETSGTWDLVHRLEEIRDYIGYVESLQECLSDSNLKSRGLKDLKKRIDGIYNDSSFAELKKDIAGLKGSTSNLKSVTLGVNLNERFEAKEIGLISVNAKSFSKSSVLENFGSRIVGRDRINKDEEWDGSMRFHPFSTGEGGPGKLEGMARTRMMIENPVLMMAMVPDGDMGKDVTSHMDRITDHMLAKTMKAVKEVLNKYVGLSIMNITALIPEFLYYVRWAEFIKKQQDGGRVFCKAAILSGDGKGPDTRMIANGFYNLRLSCSSEAPKEIVENNLVFDSDKNTYILTGANRGGKTTVTQAVGLLFVLAQGGIYVPAREFSFTPADCVFTHYPADEDKTLDYGRLGEECNRFRELFSLCTETSLLLLNETFSTTSFEEGFFIAKDAVRAILKKGTRCIYNTHMHKLASDIDSLNQESAQEGASVRAASLVALSDGGQRSFKVSVMPPQGMSYARDIARKYGVTYEMLVKG